MISTHFSEIILQISLFFIYLSAYFLPGWSIRKEESMTQDTLQPLAEHLTQLSSAVTEQVQLEVFFWKQKDEQI